MILNYSIAKFLNYSISQLLNVQLPAPPDVHVLPRPSSLVRANSSSTSVTCCGYCAHLGWNRMPLRCLLFSSDEGLVPLIWPVLADLGIEGEHCGSAVEAVERVTNQVFQIVITDWDDQPEAEFLLKTSRERKAAVRPLTLAIVKDDASRPLAIQAGANSTLRKPLAPTQVRDTLSTARDLLRSKMEPAAQAARPTAAAPPAAFAAAAPARTTTPAAGRPAPRTPPAGTATPSRSAPRPTPAAPAASNAYAPIFVPAAASKAPEESFRAGEFLQRASSLPGKQFEIKNEVQAAEQACSAPVDPLTELEPMAADVDSVPEAPQTQELKGWASITERLNKIRQEPPKPAAPKPDLLSYENSQSTTAPADADTDAQSMPAVAPAAAQAEAELFAYIEGEAAESTEPKVANPRPNRGLRLLVVAAVAVLSVVAVWKIPPARQAAGKLYGSVFHAGSDWLNPQPVSAPQAPAQHETFGQAGEEYKLPVAANIPDASTDPAQIRVLPVVDPTAKPANGAVANNVQSQSAATATDGGHSGSGQATDAPASGADQTSQNPAATVPPAADSSTGASLSPGVLAPQVSSNQPQSAGLRPASPPSRSATQPHTVSVASTAIPSSLQSQMASSTPEASGNKPVDAALPAIQPVNLPEAAARSLLVQQADPVYPDSAKSSRQQGSVVLQVLIAADGSVQDAKFLQGSLVFARAAIDAVKQWRFKPYQMNGRAAAAQTVLTISFRPPAS